LGTTANLSKAQELYNQTAAAAPGGGSLVPVLLQQHMPQLCSMSSSSIKVQCRT
jgi:hypothetical protein